MHITVETLAEPVMMGGCDTGHAAWASADVWLWQWTRPLSQCWCVVVTVDTPDEPDKSLPEDDLQKNLAFLLDRVEGCSVSVITVSTAQI